MKTDWLAGIRFKQGFNFPRNGRRKFVRFGTMVRVRRVPFASNGKNHPLEGSNDVCYIWHGWKAIRPGFPVICVHTRGDGQELGQVRAIPTCVSRSGG